MNIFSHIPGLGRGDADGEPTESDLKAERIDFHRRQVRNGPVSWKSLTAGQQRRAAERAQKREVRKNFRREVRTYHERCRVAAMLRGHLQAVELIPYVDGHTPDLHTQIVSTSWIVQRFGTEVTVDGVGTGHVSFRESDVLDTLRAACDFYGKATGVVVTVPADYEVAISLADESASA